MRPPRAYRRARWHVARAARTVRGAEGFLRPVLTLVTGAAAAQALVFATRPALTRLFTPDEFGVLTVFVTLVTVLTTVSSGRYDDALMLPKGEPEAAGVLALGLLGTAATALAAALALGWLPLWTALLGGEAMRPAVLLLPAGVALVGWSATLETWHTRHSRFRAVSLGRAVQSAVAVGVQLGAGVAAAGAVGLVGGTAAGFVAAAGVALAVFMRRDGALLRAGGVPLRSLARRYARFPLFSAPAALLNVLAGRAPVLLLAAFFSAEAVGQFGLAFGTLALPLGLVAGAVGQVFFVRASEAQRSGTLGETALAFHRRLLLLLTFPALAVLVAGPALFTFVFGEAWATAGAYARALAPWILCLSVAVPLTRVFDVTERQRADLGFSVLLFAVQVGGFALATLRGDALFAAYVLGALGAGMRVLHVAWMLRLAGAPLRKAALDVVRAAAYALPFLLAVAAVQATTDSGGAVLAAVAVGGLGTLGLAVWRGEGRALLQ